ncbi:MAG: hypothetical protein ACLTX3_08360 [Lachnospiraceae bacterium]
MTGSTVIISLISLWQKSTHRIYGIPDGMGPQKVQMLREQVFRNMGGKNRNFSGYGSGRNVLDGYDDLIDPR